MDTSEFLSREIAEDYQVVQQHGDGGCSIVYEAYRNSDQKHVAIKVLYIPESLEPDEAELTKQRFCVEAMIMRTLHDEHIVECVDYGAFEGSPCIILEFIEGKQLDRYLNEFGGVPFEYAVSIVRQLLQALEVAHNKGIIHRDVKPANIMIIEDGNRPVVRLFDFGISTMTEMPMVRTKNGVIRGTPSYMAPELFSGETRATVESDLYAAGLILLECITGQVVVAGVTVMEIAFKQAHEDLKIPSFIPKCLSSVILKCCHKNPDERYHSAHEMIEALDKALPEAIAQRNSCEFEYLEDIKNGGKKKSKTPLIIAVVAALILIAAGVGFFAGGQQNDAETPPTPPAAPEANAAQPTPAAPAQQEPPAVAAPAAPAPQQPAPVAPPTIQEPAPIAAPVPEPPAPAPAAPVAAPVAAEPPAADPTPAAPPVEEKKEEKKEVAPPPAPKPAPKPANKPKKPKEDDKDSQNNQPQKPAKPTGPVKDTSAIPSGLI